MAINYLLPCRTELIGILFGFQNRHVYTCLCAYLAYGDSDIYQQHQPTLNLASQAVVIHYLLVKVGYLW
jgi:hypothetical protein